MGADHVDHVRCFSCAIIIVMFGHRLGAGWAAQLACALMLGNSETESALHEGSVLHVDVGPKGWGPSGHMLKAAAFMESGMLESFRGLEWRKVSKC